MRKKEFKVGDKVLITHSEENWCDEMDEYVGKVATLVSVGDRSGYFKIDLDNGKFAWHHDDGHYIEHHITDEQRLVAAKETYPAGTKYLCADNGTSKFTVENADEFCIPAEGVIYGEIGKGCIFYKGKWAEIIESPGLYRVKRGDIIKFNVRDTQYRYKVKSNHLENTDSDGANNEIFNALGITTDQKMKFCDDIYGYESEFGGFPECKEDDYEALTEVIKALQDECNKINFKYKDEW